MSNFVADRHYYVDEARLSIVDESDSRAAFLLVAKGHELSEAEARRYGLVKDEVMGAKAQAGPVENKAHLSPPENKTVAPDADTTLTANEPEMGETTAKQAAGQKVAQKPKGGK